MKRRNMRAACTLWVLFLVPAWAAEPEAAPASSAPPAARAVSPSMSGVATTPLADWWPGVGRFRCIRPRGEGTFVEPGGLNAEVVARRAAATSATVRAREHDVEAERAGEDEAAVGWWPRLNLTARYTRFSPYEQPSLGPFVVAPGVGEGPVPVGTPLVSASNTFPAFVNNYYLQAQLVVPLTDYVFRVSEQTASARESRRAAELRAQAAKVRDASEARLLYYAWAKASLQELVAEKTVENSRTQHKAAQDDSSSVEARGSTSSPQRRASWRQSASASRRASRRGASKRISASSCTPVAKNHSA